MKFLAWSHGIRDARTDNFCLFALAENEVPTQTNPLGVGPTDNAAPSNPARWRAAGGDERVNHALARICAPAPRRDQG